jgi:hypothetical protein
MVNFNDVLSAYDGVVRAKHLAMAGVSNAQLQAALSRGDVARIARGVYASDGASPTLRAIRALPAEPACVSAAMLAGLWIVRAPEQPHVAVPHSRTYPGFHSHRTASPPTLLDSVVMAMRCLPEPEGLAVVESAIALGKVPMPAVRARLGGRSNARERTILSLVVPHSQSLLECLARYILRKAGFHVESQVNVPGMGHLDLMVDGQLGIETDGAEYHMDKLSFEEDRRRWNVTTRLGIPTLVVSYSLVRHRPDEFVALVRETLRSLGQAA